MSIFGENEVTPENSQRIAVDGALKCTPIPSFDFFTGKRMSGTLIFLGERGERKFEYLAVAKNISELDTP